MEENIIYIAINNNEINRTFNKFNEAEKYAFDNNYKLKHISFIKNDKCDSDKIYFVYKTFLVNDSKYIEDISSNDFNYITKYIKHKAGLISQVGENTFIMENTYKYEIISV